MKRAWLPEKPKKALKCKTCHGAGLREMPIPGDWRLYSVKCPACGGKGFK